MRLTKTIKRIVAIGAGATMVGATIMGAMAAADLASYPSPFVKDGKFGALIVVGDSAKADDVLGSIDIATSLQYMSKTAIPVSGSVAPTVAGAVKIETSAQKLHYGMVASTVKESITSSDWPVLLKAGSFTDDDGVSFKYTQQIKVPGVGLNFSKSVLSLTDPVLFLDWATSATKPSYILQLDFPTAVNLTKCVNQVITIAGKDFTFSGQPSELDMTTGAESVVLYGGGVDKTIAAAEKATIQLGSGTSEVDVPVEVVGVNTQSSPATATISINGESRQVQALKSYSIGNIRVYIRDIMAYTAPAASGAVRMFIGSDKMTLAENSYVTMGTSDTELSGVKVNFTSAGGKVSRIIFITTPYSLDPQVKGTVAGEKLVDPLTQNFKVMFEGATPAIDAVTKDVISLKPTSTNRLELDFTNSVGQVCNLQLAKGDSANHMDYLTSDDADFRTTSVALGKDDQIVLTYAGETHVVKFDSARNTSGSGYVKLRDVAVGGGIYEGDFISTVGTGNFLIGGHSYSFTAGIPHEDASTGTVTVSGASQDLYTKSGAKITLPRTLATESTFVANVTEETLYNTVGTPDNYGLIKLEATFTTNNTGNTMRVTSLGTSSYVPTAGATLSTFMVQKGNNGYDYEGLTPYGTFVTQNTDTAQTGVTMLYNGEETVYNVFFAPVEATATAGNAEGITYYETTPINVGSAVLASEVTNVRAQNVILVGGPCANAATFDIMGYTAADACTKGFVEGQAMLKLFENNGNVALVVAGWSGMDTRRAARVLASDVISGNYVLKGTEMVVSGTSWSDITVQAPSPA